MQFIETALLVAVPVQLWGPLRVMVPSAVTLPLNASNGAAIDNWQAFSVTCSVLPIKEGSQCALTSHAPLRFGQPLLPALPGLPAPPEPAESDELPHAAHKLQIATELPSNSR